MRNVIFVLVIFAVVMVAGSAYAPLVLKLDDSQSSSSSSDTSSSSSSSSNQDSSVVDLSDKDTSQTTWSPSFDKE